MAYATKAKRPNSKRRDDLEWWLSRRLGGHVNIGPLTIYGFNAMHFAFNLKTRWGYLCFHPTIQIYGRIWLWYLYLSPDATPTSATWGIGPGIAPFDKQRIRRRRS